MPDDRKTFSQIQAEVTTEWESIQAATGVEVQRSKHLDLIAREVFGAAFDYAHGRGCDAPADFAHEFVYRMSWYGVLTRYLILG